MPVPTALIKKIIYIHASTCRSHAVFMPVPAALIKKIIYNHAVFMPVPAGLMPYSCHTHAILMPYSCQYLSSVKNNLQAT
jgi:hypothetical protein